MTDYKISPGLLAEITAERQRQIDKGYTAESDDNSCQHWRTKINTVVAIIKLCLNSRDYPAYRKCLKELVALALAACESYDRLNKTGE